jgi:hypothetical protein
MFCLEIARIRAGALALLSTPAMAGSVLGEKPIVVAEVGDVSIRVGDRDHDRDRDRYRDRDHHRRIVIFHHERGEEHGEREEHHRRVLVIRHHHDHDHD